MNHIIASLAHPTELFAMVRYKLLYPSAVVNPAVGPDGAILNKARYTCYDLLNRTSSSFATVIKELDEEVMDLVSAVMLWQRDK